MESRSRLLGDSSGADERLEPRAKARLLCGAVRARGEALGPAGPRSQVVELLAAVGPERVAHGLRPQAPATPRGLDTAVRQRRPSAGSVRVREERPEAPPVE